MPELTPKEIAEKIVNERWNQAQLGLPAIRSLAADYLRLREQDERREYRVCRASGYGDIRADRAETERELKTLIKHGYNGAGLESRRPAGEWTEEKTDAR
jgi:hypothetical protein